LQSLHMDSIFGRTLFYISRGINNRNGEIVETDLIVGLVLNLECLRIILNVIKVMNSV
jgi:hypothetical protein